MSGYETYKAMKRANASQSRLIEKQAASIKALEGMVAVVEKHLPSIMSCPDICVNCEGIIAQLLKKLGEV